MERGSDKVPPRIDEELHRQTEPLERGAPVSSRAEDFREQEGSGDDEPGVDVRLPVEENEARAELARHLRPSEFPCDRERLVATAREVFAPDSVIASLEGLPEGRTFADVSEVWRALRDSD